MSALGLKNPLEGNTGDQEQLCLFSLPSFVWNYYLINILIVNTRLYNYIIIGTDLSELCPSALGNFLGILKSFFFKRVCTNNPSRSLQ